MKAHESRRSGRDVLASHLPWEKLQSFFDTQLASAKAEPSKS
jgi:hypothetical protein